MRNVSGKYHVNRILVLLSFTFTILIASAYSVPYPFDEKARAMMLEQRQRSTSTSRASVGTTPYILDSVQSYQLSFSGSDIWGWIAPDGQQYAIMGVGEGIEFINVTTGQHVQRVTDVCSSIRDIRTFGNYCYSVTNCGGAGRGLMIIDMSPLPDSVRLVKIQATSNYDNWHNMAIDTVTGHAYLASQNNGFLMLDLADPENPVELGFVVTRCHDLYVDNDTAFVAEAGSPFWSMWDLTDKSNPQRFVRVSIPNSGFVHQLWPTPDKQFVVSTEETLGKTVKIWRISDLENIRIVGEFLGENGVAHNGFVKGNTLYLSHYSSGVIVLDISLPNCPKILATFDLPDDDVWGVYPFTNDSLIYSSDINGTLFVLKLHEDSSFVPNFTDSDGDGTEDFCDNCLGLVNPDQTDSDGDRLGDLCDTCPFDENNDLDGDGICGDVDNCFLSNPGQEDTDGDGNGDVCDICPNDPFDDADADGLCADIDNCPTVENLEQTDSDNDGVGDACDNCPNDLINDPDGDGLCAINDNCSLEFNPGQEDSDGDGVGDACDNCALELNSNQADADSDLLGDLCDNCPNHFNPDQTDSNGDGRGDACCCVGTSGNIDNDPNGLTDIADLTFLIDHLFINFPPVVCSGEANIDGDPAGTVDIADLTFLIDHLFISFPALSPCQ